MYIINVDVGIAVVGAEGVLFLRLLLLSLLIAVALALAAVSIADPHN